MRLIEGVHACDSQIYELRRLAQQLGMTEVGEATECRRYGATRWCELRWQDADELERSLRRIVELERVAGGDVDVPPARFWNGPV